VVAALAGDWEAARRVELVLPETGVCSGPVAAGGVENSCCGPVAPVAAAALIELTPVGAASLIELTPVAAVASAESCCSTVVQATCCAPEEKGACCGVSAGEPAGASCGCQ
jgi:hypothetical protein